MEAQLGDDPLVLHGVDALGQQDGRVDKYGLVRLPLISGPEESSILVGVGRININIFKIGT